MGRRTVRWPAEAPVPVRLAVVDLLTCARQPEATSPAREYPDDQYGHLSVATVLDQWVRDWRDLLWPDHHLPVPTVSTLAGWLRRRLDDACDRHPAIDSFADELRSIRSTLRTTFGYGRYVDRLPAPCPDCDMMSLYRDDGASWVECGNCGRLWSENEYQRLCVILAADVAT